MTARPLIPSFDFATELEKVNKYYLNRQWDELVQDRMSELITHFDNQERVSEIANELYEIASRRLK